MKVLRSSLVWGVALNFVTGCAGWESQDDNILLAEDSAMLNNGIDEVGDVGKAALDAGESTKKFTWGEATPESPQQSGLFAGRWSPDMDVAPLYTRVSSNEPRELINAISNTDSPVTTNSIISPSGYGHYCSMNWSSGGWGFAADFGGNDPCGYLTAHSDPGGTISRAGMVSGSGMNTAVVRCTDNTTWVYYGIGNAPLAAVYAAAGSRPGCVFTVSPRALPIFNAPMPNRTTVAHATGFDFARQNFYSVKPSEFGQSGSSPVTRMNQLGKGMASSFIDEHDGHDWPMAKGTPLYAMAGGTVVASRWFNTGCTGTDSPIQGEVYIEHVVDRVPSTYSEKFVASYFHLQALNAALSPGSSVVAGTYLGDVGYRGCASNAHLHLAVFRTTNTAHYRSVTIVVPAGAGNNGFPYTIDPYGFNPPSNVDPWGVRTAFVTTIGSGTVLGAGALSVNLWKSGQAPNLGAWGL